MPLTPPTPKSTVCIAPSEVDRLRPVKGLVDIWSQMEHIREPVCAWRSEPENTISQRIGS
jgi:hypothetical protein